MKRFLVSVVCLGGLGCGGVKRYDGPRPPVPPRILPDESIWYQDISAAPVDAESPSVISGLQGKGGFGLDKIRIDFQIEVLTADESAPMMPFMPARGFYEPDCDLMPVPIPANGALEEQTGYTCFGDGDCHLIVQHLPTRRLYEMWHADLTNGLFTGGCLAVWDMSRAYGPNGRGHNCTSADAAGFPIAPLLFTSEEVASGEIPHAIRFILPNDRIRAGVYVSPATHSTSSTSGAANTPPYGARFRLRADYPIDLLPEGPRVVARALQRYGMFLADGGMKALTARSDRFSDIKWNGPDGLLLSETDLAPLRVNDFEMVEAGPRIPFTADCVREPGAPTP
jgi:serine/threonine-protein kinase